VIDDEARSSSRSGEREGLAPLIVYIYYTDFFIICKAFSQELFPGINGSHLDNILCSFISTLLQSLSRL